MDTRDSIYFSDEPNRSRRPDDAAGRGRPARGRAWAPVIVGAPVRPGRWVDLTEEDFEDPLSGAYPQVEDHRPVEDDQPDDHRWNGFEWNGYEWIEQVPQYELADQYERAEGGDEPLAWWDVPIWKPPRLFLVLGALVLSLVAWPLSSKGTDVDRAGASVDTERAGSVPTAGASSSGADAFGRPWSTAVPGVLTFLGNPSRSFNGLGPLPSKPRVLDRRTPPGSGAGPASQTLVAERPDGRTWAITSGMDGRVGFADADTGEELLAPLETSRPIRATPTLDPDGYPLLYVGGDDGELRVIALDRGQSPKELWSLRSSSVSPSQWGTDWNGSPLLRGDLLVVGGGNSNLHVIRLNRETDANGRVTVDPQLVANVPTWDEELSRDLGDRETGVDASIALDGQIAYVVNGGGLLTGWDLSPVDSGGEPRRVLRFWAGGAVDTSVTLDETGAVYLATSGRRRNGRTAELGRVMKLDPTHPDDPLVWSSTDVVLGQSGVVGAPAITAGLVVVVGEQGELVGFDRESGQVLWVRQIQAPALATPVMVDDALLLGSCDGLLRAWDLSREGPEERWSVNVGGCIESPVTAWNGQLFVSQRDGGLAVVGDAPTSGS